MNNASAAMLLAGFIAQVSPVFATDGAVATAHYASGNYAAYRE